MGGGFEAGLWVLECGGCGTARHTRSCQLFKHRSNHAAPTCHLPRSSWSSVAGLVASGRCLGQGVWQARVCSAGLRSKWAAAGPLGCCSIAWMRDKRCQTYVHAPHRHAALGQASAAATTAGVAAAAAAAARRARSVAACGGVSGHVNTRNRRLLVPRASCVARGERRQTARLVAAHPARHCASEAMKRSFQCEGTSPAEARMKKVDAAAATAQLASCRIAA